MGYNDQIAISAPCKTDFKGAVPGAIFISLLKNSKAKEVELSLTGNELLIKAASSRLKLPVLPPSDFVFDIPAMKTPSSIPIKGFIDGVKGCLRSVSTDTSAPDQLGITLIPNEGKLLQLFSWNGATISTTNVKIPEMLPFKRAVLSGLFCQQMVNIAASGKDAKIEVDQEHSLFACGGVTLYGRPIAIDKPMPFVTTVQAELPKHFTKSIVSIPTKLKLILERAIIVTDSATEQTTTSVSVKEGRMKFTSKSGRGEVTDTILVEAGQKDATIDIHCRHIKAGYGAFDKMLVTETCFIMTKDDGNSLYLIAAVG